MKVLVLGSKGQLGQCLCDQLSHSDHEVLYASRLQVDITNFETTKENLLDIHPDLVINASAYTAVDEAEEEYQTAELVNHFAVSNIANICAQLDCWLIHISTDYVFDGNSNMPYDENDKTNPQGVYGITKLKGENAIQFSGCRYIIIRTAWVYSEYGNNFLKTMLRLGTELDELSVVGDQKGCPTYAQNLASAIVVILKRLNVSKDIVGIYHYVGEVSCSWADFAEDIFQEAMKLGIIKNKPKVNKISTLEYPTPAKRPMQSQLDFSKFKNTFGITQLNYSDSIHSALEGYSKLKQ